MGALEASMGRVRGQKAYRVAPIPGPTPDWGAWSAMLEQGARMAMPVPGIREAWPLGSPTTPKKNVLGRVGA